MARTGQIVIFLTIFALILTASHFYIFSRVSYYLQLGVSQRRSLAWILGSLSLFTLLAIPVSRMLSRDVAKLIDWVIFPWMGFALLLLVVLIATDLIWLVISISPIKLSYDPERRIAFQRVLGTSALGVTAALGSYALWNGLRTVIVKPLTVTLDRLPTSLDGLRICQITDLHIGPLIDGVWLKNVVDQVNALNPDLIVVTGDLVDGSVDDLRQHVAPIAELKAPLGVYYITGNHEYYSGVEEWCAHVASLGLRVLRNERVTIFSGDKNGSFDLVGVDDWGSQHFPGEGPNLPKALAGRDPDKTLILLAHQPAAIHEAARHGVDLQLSGHTHGGQIWPFTYLVYLQQPFVAGLHRYAKTATQIYVSPGTGFWGPPMRLGTSAEITAITLRSPSTSHQSR